ncbi:MAG: hypothetical protein B6D41_04895, partial [Chloroflexi bacterium UTCFX4]
FLAVLVNPNGARMFIYPFETLTSPAMQRYIQEWFSPDFHQTEWLPFAFLIVSLLATTLLARARVPLAHILLLCALGLLALRSARNIPLFVLVAIPVLSAQLAAWIPLRASNTPTPRPLRIINRVIVAAFALGALLRVGGVLSNQAAIEREKCILIIWFILTDAPTFTATRSLKIFSKFIARRRDGKINSRKKMCVLSCLNPTRRWRTR